MTSISKTNKALFSILILVLTILVIYLLLPKSVGSAWDINMLANINLPDLGVDSAAASVNSQSLVGYVAFMKIVATVSGLDTLGTCHIMVFFGVLYVFLSYLLIRRLLPGNEKVKRWITYLYPILLIFYQVCIFTGYVFAPAMFLFFLIAFCLLYSYKHRGRNYSSILAVLLVAWISLGLFWHSMQIITYALMFFFMFVLGILNIISKGKQKYVFNSWSLFFLVTAILIVTWIYLRANMLEGVLRAPFFNIGFMSLFAKGSFVGQYQYESTMSLGYVDIVRYGAYILVYFLMIIIAVRYLICVVKRKGLLPENVSFASTLIVIFILTDITFQLLYFIATRTVGPGVIIMLSYPFILIYLNSKMGQKAVFLSKYRLNRVLTIFLVLAFALTSVSTLYEYITETPHRNLSDAMYKSSFDWIVDNSGAEEIFSDSATGGNYQLLYLSSGVYKQVEINMISIDYNAYDSIAQLKFKNQADSLLVINSKLYEKHLIFSSLQSWNNFEPISPLCISQNTQLNVIFNDNTVMIAK
jgi:hypothetical protein